jgi:hypothetical protein
MPERVFDRDFFVRAGRRGANATNSKLSAVQRKKSAEKAANARWAKTKALVDEIKAGTKRLEKKATEGARRAEARRNKTDKQNALGRNR